MTVGIIGSGIAGLACARRLADAGIETTLLDKARGPGGRLATKRRDDWQADLGAQYFTARDPTFRTVVQRWSDADVIAPWPATPVRLERGKAEPGDDDPGETRWVGVPRMSALTRHLAEGLAIKAGATITEIRRDDDGWRVCEASGTVHGPFDDLVLATPAPQAAPLLGTVAPGMAREVAALRMQGCWAAALAVTEPGPSWDAAFVLDHPLRWVARDGSKPGRERNDIWVVHAAADWSEQWMELDADDALAALVDLFRDATGVASRVDGLLAHRWRYSQGLDTTPEGFLVAAEQRLAACGGWCNGDRVEGAWLSGHQLAGRLIGAQR